MCLYLCFLSLWSYFKIDLHFPFWSGCNIANKITVACLLGSFWGVGGISKISTCSFMFLLLYVFYMHRHCAWLQKHGPVCKHSCTLCVMLAHFNHTAQQDDMHRQDAAHCDGPRGIVKEDLDLWHTAGEHREVSCR